MSDNGHSPSPGGDEDRFDNENGARNGDRVGEEAERGRRRSPSNDRARSKSRSHSGSKSRHSKKRKTHRRSRSRSKERSRSRSHHRRSSKKHSRSRSRSRSHDRDRRRRVSRSPSYGKNRYAGSGGGGGGGQRDAPQPSRCLGVFGMSMYTDEKQLRRYFSQFGEIETIQIVYDRKTGRSRGFAFIYFVKMDDAVAAKDQAVGTEIDGQRVRIDYSITRGPHAPTPGQYMGRRRDGHEDSGGRYGGGSPSYRRRSRSNSFSPRR